MDTNKDACIEVGLVHEWWARDIIVIHNSYAHVQQVWTTQIHAIVVESKQGLYIYIIIL